VRYGESHGFVQANRTVRLDRRFDGFQH
jgi:hypothetical protein